MKHTTSTKLSDLKEVAERLERTARAITDTVIALEGVISESAWVELYGQELDAHKAHQTALQAYVSAYRDSVTKRYTGYGLTPSQQAEADYLDSCYVDRYLA